MSETLSIFVGADSSIEGCRQIVEDHLQTPLRQRMDSEEHLFEGEAAGACVALFDNHGLVDDCGIEFTQFSLEIDFTHYAGTKTSNWSEASFRSLVISLAERLSQRFRSCCIVVENFQRIVRRIGPSSV